MINFHLNGDIVRCADTSAAKKRHYEQRDARKICKYGITESNCSAWNNSLKNWQNVKYNSDCGRCNLSGSINCPGHIKQSELGRKEKSYKVDNVTYRKMASAAHDIVKTSAHKTLFLTLTLPQYKNKKEPDEKIINECFSKFVENLRTNYNCTGYIAVRERGTDRNRLHFHILCSIPFVSFNVLNSAWCSALSDICLYSRSAIRTTKQTLFIKNPGKALRYVCKYFSKSKHQSSRTRLVFMSNNLIKKPIHRPDIILTELLKPYKGIYINQTSDYSTVFRITDPISFMKFCNEFLYEAFNEAYQYPIFKNKPCDFYVPGTG